MDEPCDYLERQRCAIGVLSMRDAHCLLIIALVAPPLRYNCNVGSSGLQGNRHPEGGIDVAGL